MATCIRNGVLYKRHQYNDKGICKACGRNRLNAHVDERYEYEEDVDNESTETESTDASTNSI